MIKEGLLIRRPLGELGDVAIVAVDHNSVAVVVLEPVLRPVIVHFDVLLLYLRPAPRFFPVGDVGFDPGIPGMALKSVNDDDTVQLGVQPWLPAVMNLRTTGGAYSMIGESPPELTTVKPISATGIWLSFQSGSIFHFNAAVVFYS
jgi:hypothetical protein